jgi:hypothetical protein
MTAAHEPSKEEPIDAIVEEQTPEPDYPYAARIHPMQLPEPVPAPSPAFRVGFLHFQPPTPAQYMVPRRFGMSAILGIMTALALLFGGFRLLNAPPGVYLFFGLQTLVICFAQMLNGKSPRLASSVAGAVLAPLFVPALLAGDMRLSGKEKLIFMIFLMAFSVPVGAFLGYLTGTCAAGIFLVMDYLEPYLQWQRGSSRSANA